MSSFSRSLSRFFRSDHDPDDSSTFSSVTVSASSRILDASSLPPKWSFHFRRFPCFFDDAIFFDASSFAKLDDLSEVSRIEEVGATFFNKLEKDDFLVSFNLIFFAVGEDDWEEFSNSRFDDEDLSLDEVLICGLSFRTFTDLCQASLIAPTRSTIATLLGESAQIRCFSIEPTAFPKPLSFTIDFVTGNCEILVSK